MRLSDPGPMNMHLVCNMKHRQTEQSHCLAEHESVRPRFAVLLPAIGFSLAALRPNTGRRLQTIAPDAVTFTMRVAQGQLPGSSQAHSSDVCGPAHLAARSRYERESCTGAACRKRTDLYGVATHLRRAGTIAIEYAMRGASVCCCRKADASGQQDARRRG